MRVALMNLRKQLFTKALVASLVLLLGLIVPVVQATATRQYFTRYESYTYNTDREMIPAPEAYTLERSVNANVLGVSSLPTMQDVFVTDDRIYIAASNAIHITDWDFNLIDSITEFEIDDGTDVIRDPAGLFVDDNGNIYVTDPSRQRILLFGADLQLLRAMGKPNAVGLEDVAYEPLEITVDQVGRMFVVVRNVYEGIMELAPTGDFTRFYGVNNVTFNPLELFWRSIATETQRERMALWLPTDFSNVSINEDGFVYATIQSGSESEPIKLLNSLGQDILRYPQRMRPAGDYEDRGGSSSFIAIDNNEYGSYVALDRTKNRIFTYNHDGYLLYIFGGQGNIEGTFQNPVDVKFMGDRILVVDSLAQSIEVFRPTLYGEAINAAVAADQTNNPDDAAVLWAGVAEMNPQFDLAYISMGDAAYRQGEFDAALENYRLGDYRTGYSDAFEQVRSNWLDNNITLVLFILLLIVLLLTWSLIIKPALARRQERIAERKKGVR